jgi:YVTN family beta-propeller protein
MGWVSVERLGFISLREPLGSPFAYLFVYDDRRRVFENRRSFMKRALLSLALLTLTAAAASAQATFHLAVVPNLDSSNVSIIDTTTNTEVKRIAVGPRPFYAAMSPDGKFAYVGEDGSGTPHIVIDKINLNTLKKTASLTLNEQSYLVELEISPDGRWLVAGEIQKGKIYVIDTTTFTLAYTKVLCPICNGSSQPLYSAPVVTFSTDGSTLYAATDVNQLLQVIDLASGTVVGSQATQAGGVFTDIRRGAGEQVYLDVPFGTGLVRHFDIPANTANDLSIPQDEIASIALVPGSGTTLLAAGSIEYDPNPDHLSVYDLTTGTTTNIPSSESLDLLRYNPVTGELWGTCVGAFGYCVGFQIDAFDMTTLTKKTTINGVSASALSRLPSFSQDGNFYYQPLDSNKVLVINATTHAIVKQITVGSNPRGIYMQGDTSTHETN